jgi:hypothetical protein
MKIKLLFLLLILALSYTTGFSQIKTNTKKNNLEFSTGFNSGSLKNLVFAPISRYDYDGLYYQLKYARTSKKENLFDAQLEYLNSELKSELIPILNADYSKIVLNFSYLKRVYNKNKFAIEIGLQSQTNVSSYLQWWAFDFQQKLGIAGRFSLQVAEKQSLSSKLTLPFIMWRTSTFEENFYSFNSYQSVLWNTEYKYALSNHFDVKANYNFNYDRLQISNAYRELQHQINFGINYKF